MKEKLAEEYVMVTLHDDNHAIRDGFIAGYTEAEKQLIPTRELNESIMQTNSAMGKRLLVYEQAFKDIMYFGDTDTYTIAKKAMKLPCDFPMPYSENEVLAIIEKVKKDAINEVYNADMLCGNAINRRLKDKTSCGKWCGGCDSPVVNTDIINSIDPAQFLKKKI